MGKVLAYAAALLEDLFGWCVYRDWSQCNRISDNQFKLEAEVAIQ